jgi:hypothetical protein
LLQNSYYQLRQSNYVSKINRNADNNYYLTNETSDIGIWYICPECMSKEIWEISFKFENAKMENDKSLKGTLYIERLIGSFCKQCGFIELTKEGKQLGFDKINWGLMKKEIY